MTENFSAETETVQSLLTKAFGDKYSVWNNIPSERILLTAEEKRKLTELIAEKDHYEIKRAIAKLKFKNK